MHCNHDDILSLFGLVYAILLQVFLHCMWQSPTSTLRLLPEEVLWGHIMPFLPEATGEPYMLSAHTDSLPTAALPLLACDLHKGVGGVRIQTAGIHFARKAVGT